MQVVTVTPVVIGVDTDHTNGTYGVGEAIVMKVTFNAPVYVRTTLSAALMPHLDLQGGATAPYLSGNNTASLNFLYTGE